MEQAVHSFCPGPHTPQTLSTFTAVEDYLFFLCYGAQLHTPHAGAAVILPAAVHSRVSRVDLFRSGQELNVFPGLFS